MSGATFAWPQSLGMGLGAALVIGACACAVFAIGRSASPRAGLGPLVLRLAALGLLGVVAMNPSRHAPTPGKRERPSLAVLIDTSLSMCAADAGDGAEPRRRIDAAQEAWLAPDALARLGAAASVQASAFDETTRPASLRMLAGLEAGGDATRLAHAIASALAGSSGPTDVLVLSDGADTVDLSGAWVDAAADLARAAGARVHVVPVGRSERPPNVAVSLAADQSVVPRGGATTLRARVWQHGFDGRAAELVITDRTAGRLVERRWIELGRAETIAIPFEPRAEAEPPVDDALEIELEARVTPLEGEADLRDNASRTLLLAPIAPVRVALFENEPSWDAKFFVAAMRESPGVELTATLGFGYRQQVTRYGDEQARLGAETSPVEAALFAFDVVVLGRGAERWFGGERAELLPRFVTEHGGALVLLRGPPTTGATPDGAALLRALAPIMPVQWGNEALRGGKLEATADGRAEPALAEPGEGDPFADLPEMVATRRVEQEGALSVVWLRSRAGAGADEPSAALAHMQAGRGRTLVVLTDGLWRWAFAPGGASDGAAHRRLWERVIRWLAHAGAFAPGQSAMLSVTPASVVPGSEALLTAHVRAPDGDAPATRTALVHGPSGVVRRAALTRSDLLSDRWRGAVAPSEEGPHAVELLDEAGKPVARARFDVRESRAELLDTSARRADLERLAERTGGLVLGLDGVADLERALAERSRAIARERRLEPAWNRWWVFAMIALLFGAEWTWRRKAGLP